MKKYITILAALLAAMQLSAQVRFGLGARGLIGFGLGTTVSGPGGAGMDYSTDLQPFTSLLSGGGVSARISLDAVPGLFLQPEVGIFHTQVKYDASGTSSYPVGNAAYRVEYEGSGSMYYTSIDIPPHGGL